MDWEKFSLLVQDTIFRLREADGDRDKIEAAIRCYLDLGNNYVHSPTILWDCFAISSPGIPEKAGYCGYECEQIVAIFGRLSNEKFRGQ